ncbi:MAG: peptide chain release factor 2 [Synergistaceae bacterium]|nr:peptide chain release factor 2 [Synergistaceae bacterium]MBQ9404725.1 peptide chain release factor 2 [Synergistaceae bacterium]MBR0203046.1 peptide chain release factor 2 [Synergistaceae bacterium]
MNMNQNIKSELEELHDLINPLQDSLDLPVLEDNSRRLTRATSSPEFWTQDGHEETLRQLAEVNSRLESWRHIHSEYEELATLSEILDDSDSEDSELETEFNTRANNLRREIERTSLLLLLNEPYDSSNAILMIHSGSGGLDSQDWAGMLLRMYLRYCEREGFKTNIIEAMTDEGEGIKSATVLVEGLNSYGFLKAEKGVHRLVRISPFDSNHRRHTSFASVLVSPEFSDLDNAAIDINPEDLKIDTFRASGAGGQYVNRTDSAVRITHIPTGIVVTCQNERSQHKNREVAMHVLKSRLYEIALQQRQNELASVIGDKKESTWGSQIRSYVLHPYTLVKDHRTNYEKGNIQAVLDGDINDFIMQYLRQHAKNEGI